MNTVLSFIFEHLSVRGTVCRLDSSWQEVHSCHQLPVSVKTLMGEAVAGTVLISGQLKNLEQTALQLRGGKAVPLLIAEVYEGQVRGMASLSECAEISATSDYQSLVEGGLLALVMTPQQGEQRQGIVDTNSDSLQGSLNSYFEQSEQIPSWVRLMSDQQSCAGLLLQRMPDSDNSYCSDDDWERLCMMAETLKSTELLRLDLTEILRRIFAEDDLRIVRETEITANCRCSRSKLANALKSIGEEACKELLVDRNSIDSKCDFCQEEYQFDREQIKQLF